MESQSVRLFGMCLRSDIPLPGLDWESAAAQPDVVIELGQVPVPHGPPRELAVDEFGAILTIAGVARYWITDGSRVVVQPDVGVPEANVRLFLLGSAMGVLLHQRGLLPLHASSVEIEGRAVAFIGPSGAGKSTLAAAFHDQGYGVIADDVCVIRFDEAGKAFACPGIPRLRLWEETLTATGRAADNYQLSYAGDENFRKFDLPIQTSVGQQAQVPLAAVLQLSAGRGLQFRPISGSEAADIIFANTYRGEYLQLAGNPSLHWQAAMRLISSVSIFELSRPRNLNRLRHDVGRIAEFFRQGDIKPG